MRKRAGVVGLGAALVVAGWWLWRIVFGAPQGFITGLTPIGPDEALITFRANDDDDPSRFWLARVRAGQGVVWWRELAHEPALPFYGPEAAAGGETVVVMTREGAEARVEAFRRADGEPSWERSSSAKHVFDPARLVVFDEAFAVANASADGLEVTSIGSADGGVRWEQRREVSSRDLPSRFGPWLLSRPEVWTWELIDPGSGRAVATLPSRIRPCASQEALFGVDRHHLWRWNLPDFRPTRLARVSPPSDAAEQADAPMPVACGSFGSDLVVFMTDYRGPTALAGLDPATGAERWRLDLGAYAFNHDIHLSHLRAMALELEPWSGSLTRFVPLVLVAPSAPDATSFDFHLAMVDLETRRVAWRSSATQRLLYNKLIRYQGRYYLDEHGAVTVLDGATGQMTAAAQVGEEIKPFHFHGGRLWVHSRDWRDLDEAPWAVLDAATLRPLARHGDFQPTDIRSERARTLGLPPEAMAGEATALK